MKVLVVYRDNNGRRPYITEQVNALARQGADTEYFAIKGSGYKAYFDSYRSFKKAVRQFGPDIIHCHYGISGLFANIQRRVPVVTTYHGSDINLPKTRIFSSIAIKLSGFNIFVSAKLAQIAKVKKKYIVLPCGVDFDVFKPIDKKTAREMLNLDSGHKYILFSGAYNNTIKNAPLAKDAMALVETKAQLLELNGYSRAEVNLLFSACDLALLTSFMEGSPQFVKEALACNCPVVSTDVGSVEELFGDFKGCYLTSFDVKDVADKIDRSMNLDDRIDSRNSISYLDNNLIAEKILDIYKSLSPERVND